eukprot:256517-Chlamydomonas_euryale.AAC.3
MHPCVVPTVRLCKGWAESGWSAQTQRGGGPFCVRMPLPETGKGGRPLVATNKQPAASAAEIRRTRPPQGRRINGRRGRGTSLCHCPGPAAMVGCRSTQ